MGPLANRMAADLLRKLWDRLKEKAASKKEAAEATRSAEPEKPQDEENERLD